MTYSDRFRGYRLLFHQRIVKMVIAFAGIAVAACGSPESKQTDEHADAGGGIAAGAHVHQTESETCFICDPTKRDKGRLWCAEHNRYEDRCWECHPDLEDKSRPFCSEHALYEDECTLCRAGHRQVSSPTDSVGMVAYVASPSSELFCNEHGVRGYPSITYSWG